MDVNSEILKWFNGEISDETAQQLLAADDFEFYKKLKDRTSQLALSPADVEANYERIQNKKSKKGTVTLHPKTRWLPYIGIAASLALLFGLYQVFFFSQHLQTGLATTETIVLPDQSIVTLDANSKIEYPNGFAINRKLALNGTAYFEVEKGKTFSVYTHQGTVEVLGTVFNVSATPHWFEVSCYEGKVQVDIHGQKTILTAGTSFISYASQQKKVDLTNSKPDWMSGRTEFISVPFYVVVQSLEKRFGVSINFPNNYKNKLFTGRFPHDDLDKALQAVTLPLNLKYSLNQKNIHFQPIE